MLPGWWCDFPHGYHDVVLHNPSSAGFWINNILKTLRNSLDFALELKLKNLHLGSPFPLLLSTERKQPVNLWALTGLGSVGRMVWNKLFTHGLVSLICLGILLIGEVLCLVSRGLGQCYLNVRKCGLLFHFSAERAGRFVYFYSKVTGFWSAPSISRSP